MPALDSISASLCENVACGVEVSIARKEHGCFGIEAAKRGKGMGVLGLGGTGQNTHALSERNAITIAKACWLVPELPVMPAHQLRRGKRVRH